MGERAGQRPGPDVRRRAGRRVPSLRSLGQDAVLVVLLVTLYLVVFHGRFLP